jgi:hypothetical protein
MRVPLLIVSLAVIGFTACQESAGPTALQEAGALVRPDFGATRTEGHWDIDFGWETYFQDCIYDGQGEVVDARFRFLFDWFETVTPSGQRSWVGHVTYHADTQMIGHDTGDVWTPTPATRQNRVAIDDVDGDGVYAAHNNTHEVWTNQDGEQVQVFFTWQVVVDPSGTIRLLPRGWRCVRTGPK